jgi:DNA mismatch repair protein MutL
VNVHPSKLEVKFDDERSVFSFIRKGVLQTLEKNDLVFNVKTGSGHFVTPVKTNIISSDSFTKKPSGFTFMKHRQGEKSGNVHELQGTSLSENFLSPAGADIPSDKPAEHDSLLSKNELWQFQKKYIMYQLESTLMIIDQHAAHERILYEQALDRLNSNANLSQQLLFPITSGFSAVDYEVIKSLENELKALGFDMEILSKQRVKIKGIPSDVRIGDEGKILQELVDQFKEYDVKLNLEKRDNLAKSYACKHAIKSGDYLTETEMLNLIDRLFSSKMPYVCPHGRPTIVRLTMDELDKMFYRIF